MRHGNIYPPEQAERALEGFFREGNLAALRELVLRARRRSEVEQQLDEYMREHRLEGWEASERVARAARQHATPPRSRVRRAWRLAHAFDGELFAAYPAPLAAASRG